MKTINNAKSLDGKALKERYQRCFGARADNAATLQEVVRDLIDKGVSRKTLAAWASEAGFSKQHIASVLSRIFVALGFRERQKGAGRKPSPAALILLAHVRRRYGEKFLRVLYAACRAGKAELAAENASNEISQPRLKSNCNSAIRRSIRPTERVNTRRFCSTTITIKSGFKPAK